MRLEAVRVSGAEYDSADTSDQCNGRSRPRAPPASKHYSLQDNKKPLVLHFLGAVTFSLHTARRVSGFTYQRV
ncbi:MAG: hypothetical protein ACN6OQ_21080, partial [Paraburkholderia nemoris]